MLVNLLTKIICAKLTDKNKGKRRLKKQNNKQMLISLFGKKRYYLSILFGQWVFFVWNTRDYDDILYQKFYNNEKVAIKYAKALKLKYTKVQLIKVYNKHEQIGYMLYGKGERIALSKQPSNVINFTQYINTRIK